MSLKFKTQKHMILPHAGKQFEFLNLDGQKFLKKGILVEDLGVDK